MNPVKGNLLIFYYDLRQSFLIFWSILGFLLLVTFFINMNWPEGDFFFFINFPVYIYLAITAFISLKNYYPFSMGMGSTRRNFQRSMISGFIALAALSALTLNIAMRISERLSDAWGLNIGFTSLGQIDTVPNQFISVFWLDFTICLFLMAITYAIACLHYRYGHLITYLSIAVIIMILIIPGVNDLLNQLIEGFWQDNALWYFSSLILIACVFFGAAALIMRKAPLQSATGK
ncbi:hypothetical protein HUG20_03540 [Salicibibacter cibi]|uniref:Uncharacterized protein n=1 Tax=Salicibibacter cibi TaxID=2743001 RepID=A0A7T6Z8V8_9BACI|nr:hypothetical protein [Salicibibacter cibi]QQK79065.1 hypothetical protein HUG20_03540 [Salicibibacter cibi]